MWRKIHSNRDPRDTLYSEIRKEFGGYFQITGSAFKRVAGRNPKIIFGLMVFLMVVSTVLSFTWFHKNVLHPVMTVKATVSPVTNGLNKILETTNKLRETISLKKVVDSLAGKKEMSLQDSMLMEKALDRLMFLRQH